MLTADFGSKYIYDGASCEEFQALKDISLGRHVSEPREEKAELFYKPRPSKLPQVLKIPRRY